MKVTQEKLPASQIGLEIEVPPEMSKQAYEKTVQDFTRNANIPGFRKGKVPRQVVIQRIGSMRIKATVLETLINDSLKQAVEQEKIDAIGEFELKTSFEELVSQFEPGSPLTFSAAVDVPPDVEIDSYTGLTVQAEEIKPDPDRVNTVIENYRNQNATLVPVEGRAAQEGDVAIVDFTGRHADKDGEPGEEFPGGSASDFQLDLEEGKFIPGFIEGMFGMNVGETKEVEVTFPEDYPQPDLAGAPAVFSITLKELKAKELPELDDDFAQEVSEFETIAEFQASLEERFQKEAEQKTKANKEQALLDELVKHVTVDLPDTLVRREADYMLTQTAMQLQQQGMDIKQLFTRDVVESLRERSRPEAVNRIKRTMALGEVAKRESIKVEPDEISAKVEEMMAEYAGEDVDRDRLRQVVEEDLLKEKILAWLEEHGTVELVPEGSLTPEPEEDEEDAIDPAEATIDVAATAEDATADAIDPTEATIDVAAEATTEDPTEVSEPADESAEGTTPATAASEEIQAS